MSGSKGLPSTVECGLYKMPQGLDKNRNVDTYSCNLQIFLITDVDEDGGEDEEEDGWEEGAKDLIDREPAVVDDNELHGAHRLQQIWR